ncbi:SEL1-like repeat protein [Myroides odoratimimus]|uniref:SEL1-like repeat protein n=1 Tax=Myroides odoratimimus TaxID=76832 RepID=UPI0025771555|nr:sel1 repeat family protein [Myroides odoratimimus]
MKQFTMEYLNYVREFANDSMSITAHAEEFLNKNDYSNPHEWYKAHAICMLAEQIGKNNEVLEKLYDQLNEDSNCLHSSMSLSDEDYADWFTDVKALNDIFIDRGYKHAYAYQYELFINSRYGFRDEERAVGYLKKGVELGDDLCKCYVGYAMYYGTQGYEKDEEGAVALLKTAVDGERANIANLFLLNIEFRGCASGEEGKAVVEKFSELINVKKRGLYILADYYLREDDNVSAEAALKDGIANNSAYCKYLLGMMACNGRFEELGYTEEQGRELLADAYDYGITHAGYVLGYSYFYPRTEGLEAKQEEGIEMFKKSIAYYSSEATLELAIIYLYNEEFKDIAKGIEFLDRGVEYKYDRAMSEKGFVLLDFEEVERDVEGGKALLEQAMAAGNDYAPYRLGLAYQNAEFEEEADYEKALYLFELAAERNNLSGLELAGRYHRFGYAGEPNLDKAVSYYQRGIEYFNSNYCKVELAMLLERGEGIEQDVAEAARLYEDALNEGYTYAAIRLGFIYEEGSVGEPDYAKARAHFELAAEQDMAEGVYHLARCYRYGTGGEENQEKSFELFSKALELGFIDANVDIALFYEEGINGGEPDYEKAFEYMIVGAEAGFSYAQYKVGVYYSYGYLAETNVELGKEWFEKSVESGSPLGMLSLGDYYLYGYGEEKEYDKAFEYYIAAEERNYISEGLGICYQFGLGVEVDETKAFHYYKLAADRQYDAAIFRLGLCYFYGNGTERDLVEAFHYLKQVADRGNMDAASYVGLMLVKGDGAEKDSEYGVSYLIQAAEAGFDMAQYELANCYLKGEGVPQSDDSAMEWYQQAAENGNEDAQKIVGGPRKRRR